jgi:uncharacterized 2Fe-2S/4Fe-4S cluster protein (DUF4445 family)
MNTDEIKVVINKYGSKRLLSCRRGRRLADLLRSEGISVSQPCGGMGRCGRCICRITGGKVPVTSADAGTFSAKELSEGKRLICRAVLNEDCEVELLGAEDPKAPLGAAQEEAAASATRAAISHQKKAIAIDLGTTTIAAALIEGDGSLSEVTGTVSGINHQRAFGADVISRIAASEDGASLEGMRDAVRSDILRLIGDLGFGEREAAELSVIVVAANTAMLTILAGESPQGLGRYPYTPVFLDERICDSRELFSWQNGPKVVLMPGISAFVGADILSGLYNLEITGESSAALVDLGTNGEMTYWDGHTLFVTSAAAGPVFEACGISCGVPSVEGAISHVEIDDLTHKAGLSTIADGKPIGLCGTGVMEAVSELVRTGICDETGLLSDEYFEEGFPLTQDGLVRLTREDIRNVQLAKAAIYSGIGTLLKGGIPDKVYLSGGFGTSLNADRIKNLSLFPDTFNDKIISSGNTSLKGAVKYAEECLKGEESKAKALKELYDIRSKAHVIELSDTESFEDDYINAMNFVR